MVTSEKPTAGLVLSLIGGIFILLVGILIAAVGGFMGSLPGVPGGGANMVTLLGVVGIVNGLLVMVFGILLYVKPQQHVVWGVLVIVFSVVSLFDTLGGFIIGLILGLIGGILGAVWKPPAPMAPGMMQPMPPSMPPQ
ncbi:MAG: hypothetical protein E6J94_05275 [Methanobacteriota archaeon]|nr:MAG: hypothetical protein E6J99_08440 [Euryarchaeota archaeon]TMA07330.1 MAG: hypothetical protein E6J94_05275 [Euryarchaeota archaeon]